MNIARRKVNTTTEFCRSEAIDRTVRLCLAFLVIVLACVPRARAQGATPPTDLQVEAAFLYKFGAFAHWPKDAAGGTFSICILGNDPFGQTLDSIAKGESINGKPFAVGRITNAEEASRCRIVFISDSEEARLRPILNVLDRFPVLTVSDMPRFTDRGGMIQFLVEGGRVRFDVNVTNADKAGIGLSSELLKVAFEVKHGGGRD